VTLTPPHPVARGATITPPAKSALDDTVALGAYLDGAMRQFVDELNVSGAVVAVVKNGRVLYARGYGYSDVAKKKPVDPATSLFRIGSTSKLFTWTALMQLVQQGKVDLDADVNKYITQFQIPAAFGKPVTVRSLLTHSSGFEEGALGYLIANDSTRVQPIDVTLAKHMPARVRPPGVLSSYSNYGAALAGLIVQDVSGVPFNDYIRRFILDPLDMHHATFQEPLPPQLAADAVTGYVYANGVYAPKPFEFVGGFRPAGSGSFSAIDMTHFMIAHMQNGEYHGAHILDSATTALMHARAFSNDPRLPSMALGFYELRTSNPRVIGHEGDTQHFHTAMFIVPEAQTGIFMSYVGTGAEHLREGVLKAFFDKYFPSAPPETLAHAADFGKGAEKYTGAYRFARHSTTKIDKALEVAGSPVKISVLPKENRLLVTGLGAHPAQFAPIGDSLFQQVDGPYQMGFTEDASGKVTRVNIDALPFMGTERVPAGESPPLWWWLLGLSALVFLSVLLTIFYRRKGFRALPREQKRIVWLALGQAALFFVTFIFLGAVIVSSMDDLGGAIPTSLRVALVLPIIFVLATIALLVATINVWRRSWWSVGRRTQFTIVVLACVAVSLFFANWNLLGWRFG
jgi:CubicO group peptidase (beta-lactamase class C family)